MTELGATVAYLGNNFEPPTETDIVAMGLRLASMGNLVGLTEADILSLATTMSSVGIQAQLGGSALSRVWADMQKAVQTGGKELETLAQVAGMSAGEFAGVFELRGADEATLAFIKGLQRMTDAGESVHPVLEALGFEGDEVRRTLLSMAGAGDKLEEALIAGTQAWEDNTALIREAELRFRYAGQPNTEVCQKRLSGVGHHRRKYANAIRQGTRSIGCVPC